MGNKNNNTPKQWTGCDVMQCTELNKTALSKDRFERKDLVTKEVKFQVHNRLGISQLMKFLSSAQVTVAWKRLINQLIYNYL